MRRSARRRLSRSLNEPPCANASSRGFADPFSSVEEKGTVSRRRPFNELRPAAGSRVLNRDRVRFEVAGGNYRLIAAFDFRRQITFVKFVGTHAEYDRIDALTVSQF